jgi:hypothetical protein
MSTQDVLNCFVTALGRALKLIADFGDEQLEIDRLAQGLHRLAGAPTTAAAHNAD